jgi:hypothetical protein
MRRSEGGENDAEGRRQLELWTLLQCTSCTAPAQQESRHGAPINAGFCNP